MSNILIFIARIFVFLAIVISIIYIIRQKKSISYERRIGRYSIESMKTHELSFFDKLLDKYNNLILNMRDGVGKSKLLNKISNRYSKYVEYGSDIVLIDFISKKILVGVLFVIIAMGSVVINGKLLGIMGIIINFIIGFYLYDLYLIYQKKRRNKLLKNEMFRAIIIMNNAFKSGKSIVQAVEIASRELEEPINHEFEKIYTDLKYGLNVSTVFERFAKRNDVEEARYLAATLTTLNRTGGNIVKVFNSIERTMFDKKKLDEELKNLTASSNLVVKILFFEPIIFVGIIYFMDNSYFKPLFSTVLGYIVLIIMILMFIIYIMLLKRIMRVDV